MKSFFKIFSASCLGTIAALALLLGVLMLIGTIGQMGADKIDNKSVLMLDFNHMIPERTNNVEQSPYDFESPEAIGLRHYQKLIDNAKTNSSISGIVIKNPNMGIGQAKADIIRTALSEFRDSSDKFVFAYGDYYSQMGYYLSSVCDSIYLNPMGNVDIRGKSALIPFFKEMMDKAGIKMDIFYAGNFKSATEPFRRTNMSEQSKMQTREYLNAMYDEYLNGVSDSRSLDKNYLHQLIDNYSIQRAEDALEENLVDQIAYFHEFEDILRTKLGLKKGKKVKYVDIGEFYSKVKLADPNKKSKDKIAVVYAEGEIQYGQESKGLISEKRYHPIFNKIKKDDKIKALVLRVNSPGGSAFSSDEIWNEIETIKNQMDIPVVASFGTYAASGGYYISAGADTIVSEPSTLTGSIGVFSMIPNVRELMNDKLGISFDTVKTAKYAVGITGVMDMSEEEKSFFTTSTNLMYEKFLKRVADGRGMTRDEVHEVAQGRVWTGTKAKDLGLVDELGDLDRAIEIAAEMANLEKYKLTEYPRIKKSMWEELVKSFAESSNVKLSVMDPLDLKYYNYYNTVKGLLKDPHPQARLPFIIEH